jgi:4-amino-4-deoxy-L-arabinose transferase-like glycosyltransferase
LESLTPPIATSLLGFIITLFAVLAFYLVRRDPVERSWLLGLALAAFLLKAILVPIYFQWLVSIGNLGFAYFDAAGVHYEGIVMAEEISLDLAHNSWAWAAIDPGFFMITAYTYIIFGPNTFIIRFMLIMCVSMSLLYVYRIARLYFDEPTARLAAAFQAFVPMPILLSLNHRKDPLIQLIVLFMFYHAVRIFRQDPGWQRSTLMVFAGLFAVYPLRSGLILPFLGVMVICFVLANRNVVQGMGLTAVTLIGLVVLQVAGSADSRVSLNAFTERAEGKLAHSAQLSEQGSGLARRLRVTGPLDLYKVPLAAFAYLLLPFPPNLDERPESILAAFLNLVSIFMLPHLLLGAWSMIRGPNWRSQLPLLIFPIVFLLVLGAVHIGVGRYKQTFFPICLIWTAVGWRLGTSFFFKGAVYGGIGLLTVLVYLNRYLF